MYIFSFNRFAWFDRVFRLKISDDSVWWWQTMKNWWYQKILRKGNLIAYQDDFFLCLWDEISFQEQYGHKYEIKIGDLSLIYKIFLSDKTLEMVNRMVYYRYSNYKSVMKYFVSFDVQKLVEPPPLRGRGLSSQKSIKSKKIINSEIIFQNWKFEISENKIEWQQLVIFPDLWTIFNTLDEEILSKKWNVLLSSNDTQNQKDKKWWAVKSWDIKNVFCTHSEIFQDRNNLKKIILIDPYKRYYENQQDPRYNVKTVVEKMSEIYESKMGIW